MTGGDVEPSRMPPLLRRLGPGLAGLLSLLIFLSLPLVPLLGVFTAILSPLPLVHLFALTGGTAMGWGWVMIALIGVSLATTWPGAIGAAAGYLLIAAWPAFSVELWVRHRWSSGRWLAIVAGGALGVLAGVLVAMSHPEAPALALERLLAPSAADSPGLAGLLGVSRWSGEELVAAAVATLAALAPAIGALYVAAVALWLRPRLALLGLPVGHEPFAAFSSEEWLPVAFVIGGLGWVFASGLAKWLSVNLLVVVIGLYFVHGLAIIHHYLGRRLASKRLVRVVVGLIAVQMPLALGVAAAGLTDAFVRLRCGSRNEEESTE